MQCKIIHSALHYGNYMQSTCTQLLSFKKSLYFIQGKAFLFSYKMSFCVTAILTCLYIGD